MTYQKKIIRPKHFELIFALLFFGCASIPYGLSNHKFDNDIDQEDVYEHIKYLSSDALEGRYPGTKGSQLAIDYISHQFKKIRFCLLEITAICNFLIFQILMAKQSQFQMSLESFQAQALKMNTL